MCLGLKKAEFFNKESNSSEEILKERKCKWYKRCWINPIKNNDALENKQMGPNET